MNVFISRLKIKLFHLNIYHANGNNNLVERIKELTTGRDPPEILPFRIVKNER